MPELIPIFDGYYLSLYVFCSILALAVFLVLGDVFGQKCGFSYAKSMLYVGSTWVIWMALLFGMAWIMGGGKMTGTNHIRTVVFLPIALFPLVRLLKDNYWKVTDYLAPLIAIFHGITCLGCIFPGCCHGYPSSWGIYSNQAKTVCFPLQPIEAGVNILIGVILLIMKKHKVLEGRLYAAYLIMLGTTRVLLEFLRDNDKILLGLSEFAIHAMIALLVGFISLIFINNYRRKKHINR